MKPYFAAVAFCVSIALLPVAPSRAEEKVARGDRGAPLFSNLGNHHFPVTTASKDAQRFVNQGVILSYAFNHPEAIRSFREAARLDPDCAMAWWGVALALGPNINKPMGPDDAAPAWEALTKARAAMAKASDRERAYIEALSARYAEHPPQDRAALDKAYADAMRKVTQRFPDDLDAATFFAEALMDTMPWRYWMNGDQPREETKEVLAALEGVLARQPNHPGACHYYIHAVEAAHPAKALAAADTLRDLVPAAGHMVHMPAHIYLRLGLYREATLVNELAAAADASYISQCGVQGFYPATYYPHNVHFLWYTNAMEGRSAKSIEAARTITSHAHHMPLSEADRFAPIVTMALVRFGRWDEVLAEPPPAPDQPFATAMAHYTRGLALAANARTDDAAKELATLTAIAADDKTKALETEVLPGATLLRMAQLDLTGQLALRKGETDKAIDALQKAVAIEDALPYMEPPYAYLPMRHGLGAALLTAGRAADAETVYREDLRRNPHNGWSLFGLAQSLRAQGKPEVADEVMQRFNLAWQRADIKLNSSRFETTLWSPLPVPRGRVSVGALHPVKTPRELVPWIPLVAAAHYFCVVAPGRVSRITVGVGLNASFTYE